MQVCDDQPNSNRVGIRAEDLYHLAASSVFMPIKMAPGHIHTNHDYAAPLGVITEGRVDSNKFFASGVLWEAERPEDVNILLEQAKSLDGAYVSWELHYSDCEYDIDNNVTWIKSPTLTAIAVVGDPAYRDRAQVLSVASDESTSEPETEPEAAESEVVPETQEPEQEPVSSIVNQEPAPEETQEQEPEHEVTMSQADFEELQALRAYKAQQERLYRIAQVRGMFEGLTDEHAQVLADLNDSQLDVVKSLVASRKVSKESAATKEPQAQIVVPEIRSATTEERPMAVVRSFLLNTK